MAGSGHVGPGEIGQPSEPISPVSGVGEGKKMMEATSYMGNVEMTGGQFRDASAAVADEERLAEVIVSLMRNNREVRNAILQVVMSCPNLKWEM
jgi:hypothetical protein